MERQYNMRIEIKELGDAADVSSGKSESTKELFKLIFLAALSILTIYFIISSASEYFVSHISIEQEKKWFDTFDIGNSDLEQLNIKVEETSSNEIEQAKHILQKLSKHPDVPKLNYRLFVIKDEKINAFAFPGGSIGITSGLLEALQSNSKDKDNKNNIALAFVIGHELGHFKFRHHLKGLARTISIGLAFALVTGNNGDLSIVNNLLTLLELNHSKKQELESDQFSAKLVYDTFGTTKNIEKLFLIVKEKNNENESLSFLSTHPSSKSRMIKLLHYSNSFKKDNR